MCTVELNYLHCELKAALPSKNQTLLTLTHIYKNLVLVTWFRYCHETHVQPTENKTCLASQHIATKLLLHCQLSSVMTAINKTR